MEKKMNRDQLWAAIKEIEREIGIENNYKLFSPCVDFAFKAIFTQDSEESRLARIDFLSCILGLDVETAEIAQNELPILDANEKKSAMDLHVKLHNGERVNVEIQMQKHDDVITRSEFSVCKLFASQSAKGLRYDELHRVYVVMIAVDFVLFKEREKFTNDFAYRNEEGELMSGNTRIIFLELPKLENLLAKPIQELTGAEMWAIFLKYKNDEKKVPLVREIEVAREGIMMANQVLNTISDQENQQFEYFCRLRYEMDQASMHHYALKKGEAIGEARGVARGVAKERREMVTRMAVRGLDVQQIADLTGYELPEVQRIVEQQN